MDTFTDASIDELRAVGYELEPLVGHGVRGRSSDGLQREILEAIDELDGEPLAEALNILRSHGFESAASAVVEDAMRRAPKTDADDSPAEQAGAKTDDQAPATEAPHAAAAPGGLVCLQLLCQSERLNLYWHDVLIDPPDKVREHIVGRLPHARLSLERAAELISQGHRWSREHSLSDTRGRKLRGE